MQLKNCLCYVEGLICLRLEYCSFYGQFGIGVAVSLGGFLSEISYELTVMLSALSVMVVSVIAYIWPEVKASESTEEVKYWQFVKNSFKTVTHNRTLLQPMIYTAIVLAG